MAWRCLEVGKPNRCVRRNRGRWKGRWGVLGRSSSGQHIYLHNLLRHRLGKHRSQEWQPKSTSTSLVASYRDLRAGVSDPSYVSAHWFFSLGSSFARHICLKYKKNDLLCDRGRCCPLLSYPTPEGRRVGPAGHGLGRKEPQRFIYNASRSIYTFLTTKKRNISHAA